MVHDGCLFSRDPAPRWLRSRGTAGEPADVFGALSCDVTDLLKDGPDHHSGGRHSSLCNTRSARSARSSSASGFDSWCTRSAYVLGRDLEVRWRSGGALNSTSSVPAWMRGVWPGPPTQRSARVAELVTMCGVRRDHSRVSRLAPADVRAGTRPASYDGSRTVGRSLPIAAPPARERPGKQLAGRVTARRHNGTRNERTTSRVGAVK